MEILQTGWWTISSDNRLPDDEGAESQKPHETTESVYPAEFVGLGEGNVGGNPVIVITVQDPQGNGSFRFWLNYKNSWELFLNLGKVLQKAN